jgi:muconolactone delta-isomerase
MERKELEQMAKDFVAHEKDYHNALAARGILYHLLKRDYGGVITVKAADLPKGQYTVRVRPSLGKGEQYIIEALP